MLDRDSKLTGIVTASDVVSTLLVALNREAARIEDVQGPFFLDEEEGGRL